MIKDILVPLGASDDGAKIATAFPLAERLSAHLTGALAFPDPAHAIAWAGPAYTGVISAQAVDTVRMAQEDASKEADAAFKEAMGTLTQGTAQFERVTGLPEMVVFDRATLADLVVFSHADARGETQLSATFDRVLMDGRRPILVPNSSGDAINLNTIAVAWDGSPEARHAVSAALPILQQAQTVHLLQCEDKIELTHSYAAAMPRMVEWLKTRGVTASSQPLAGSPSDTLVPAAKDTGAELLVAGAYGHSRTREFFFGGATRSLLGTKDSDIAMLVAH